MEFYNDPFATMFEAFEDIFPDHRVEVGWVPPEEINHAKGCCSWAADGKGLIAIDITLPVIGAVDILCHELAHAVACEGCPDEDGDHHCEDWKAAYEAIRKRYIKLVEQFGDARKVEIPDDDQCDCGRNNCRVCGCCVPCYPEAGCAKCNPTVHPSFLESKTS